VLECLKKSLKIADGLSGVDSAVGINLFVEILNEYVYYYLKNNDAISVEYLNTLIALINTNMATLESSENSDIIKHYQNTLQYIKSVEDDDSHPSFKAIQIPSEDTPTD